MVQIAMVVILCNDLHSIVTAMFLAEQSPKKAYSYRLLYECFA